MGTAEALREIGGKVWRLHLPDLPGLPVPVVWSQASVEEARSLDARRARALAAAMDLPDDELGFLRDLVKAARQRTQVVSWVDRDGSKRQTVLTAAEAKRLTTIAHRLRVSGSEVLRQAAHIPVTRSDPAGAGSPPAP